MGFIDQAFDKLSQKELLEQRGKLNIFANYIRIMQNINVLG